MVLIREEQNLRDPQMLNKLIQEDKFRLQLALCALLVFIGIILRFYNINKKIVAHDEPFTLIRASGHSELEIIDNFATGRRVYAKDIKEFIERSDRRNVSTIVKNLLKEDSHILPLYFVLLRLWSRCFGVSVVAIRSFSAFISILILPCIFWLANELFNSRKTGLIALVLVAISSLHIVYAQEARFYSLFALTIVLSSAALLTALRKNRLLYWIIYAAALISGLYTHLLFIFVIVAHCLYVTVIKFRERKIIFTFFLAVLASLLFFAPYGYAVAKNWAHSSDSKLAWITKSSGIDLPRRWLFHLAVPLFDFIWAKFFLPEAILPDIRYGYFFYPFLLGLIIYSVYFLFRTAPRKIWVFILFFISTNAFPLIFLDLFQGGRRSGEIRYFFQSLIGVQLLIVYLLSEKISTHYTKLISKIVWLATTAIIICGSLLSCLIYSQAPTWWNKYFSSRDIYFRMKIVNSEKAPLVLFTTRSSVMQSSAMPVFLAYNLNNMEAKIQRIDRLPEPHTFDKDAITGVFIGLDSREIDSYKIELNRDWERVYKGNGINLYKLR